jgi:hypothetical protein
MDQKGSRLHFRATPLFKEVKNMWNEPTKERMNKIPKLYETEDVPLKEKQVHLHFFIGGCDWYICETNGDMMWGFCILNNDYEMAEWGYVSLSELRDIKIDGWVEVDCELEALWKVIKAFDVDKIRIARGWTARDNNSEPTPSITPGSIGNPEQQMNTQEDRPC